MVWQPITIIMTPHCLASCWYTLISHVLITNEVASCLCVEPYLSVNDHMWFNYLSLIPFFVTPHAHAWAGGYVIRAGVHRHVCGQFLKIVLSNRITFSNICGRTSRRIYRPALPLLSPEMRSSSSKSRFFLYNAHHALFVQMYDTITRTNASVSIVI